TLDNSESAFVDFTKHLLAEEYSDCNSLATTQVVENYYVVYEPYRDMMTNVGINPNTYANMKIYSQFLIGNDSLFIWGVDQVAGVTPVVPLRRSFNIVPGPDPNSFRWEYSHATPESPLYVLLNKIEQARSEITGTFDPITSYSSTYSYKISDSNITENEVFLKLNGTKYDIDIFSEDVDPNDTVAFFYQTVYHALRDGDDPNAFGGYMTDKSEEKYLAAVARYSETVTEQSIQNMVDSGRHIIFIINADPVYVIFFR
ncbi:unnamed protein product, partial [marine sediment metagenome]